MNSTQLDGTSRGGLAVVFVCFFVFGFLVALLVQFVLDAFWQGSQNRSSELSDMFAETMSEKVVEPEARFSPQEVVAYQLEGLSSAHLAAGIRQCFGFASPSNKHMTGPLDRFAHMVRSPPYSVLLSPRELLIGESEIEEDHASVTVSLLDTHGEVHVFLFLLTKQTEGELSGCWMTESVFPLHRFDANKPERPPTASSPWAPSIRSRELGFRRAFSIG